jgi:hypothetical protein
MEEGRSLSFPRACWSQHRSYRHLPVTESVALPPELEASIMSQTVTWFDPGLAGIERPPGLNCKGPVMFTGIASGTVGDDLRNFECVMCDDAEDGLQSAHNLVSP